MRLTSSLYMVSRQKTIMKKKYTRKQILESIKYWQKQLKMMNESINDKVKINVYDIEWLDVGTTTDIAPRQQDMYVNLNKNIIRQINDEFYLSIGIIPLTFKFSTIDSIKCKDYDKLKNEI